MARKWFGRSKRADDQRKSAYRESTRVGNFIAGSSVPFYPVPHTRDDLGQGKARYEEARWGGRA